MKKKNKNDLIQEIASELMIDETGVRTIINLFLELVKHYFINGWVISIKGFCVFDRKEVKPRVYQDFSEGGMKMAKTRILPKARFSNVIIEKIKNGGD